MIYFQSDPFVDYTELNLLYNTPATENHQPDSIALVHKALGMAVKKEKRVVTLVDEDENTSELFYHTQFIAAQHYPRLNINFLPFSQVCHHRIERKLDYILTNEQQGIVIKQQFLATSCFKKLYCSSFFGRHSAIFQALEDESRLSVEEAPESLLLASANMMGYFERHITAENIRQALGQAVAFEDRLTPALGGHHSCTEFIQAIIERLPYSRGW